MDNPSEQLAKKIIERLIQEKLLASGDYKKFSSGLATGKLKPEDWRLAIELADGGEAKS